MIREDLYAAVASVLAFVLSLGRGDHMPLPNIDLPIHMRFDADGRPEAVIDLKTASVRPS
ncbi:hypothetical protein [Novosphingobium sp. THN1]